VNLTTKINLILGATFAIGLSLVGVNSYLLTEDNALQQVTDQAELIMQEALAVRSYTVNEIRPLLNRLDDGQFHRQTVPAYSATQTANLGQGDSGRRADHQSVYRQPGIDPAGRQPGNKRRQIAVYLLPDSHYQSQLPGLPQ
jgi:hypothetical protein